MPYLVPPMDPEPPDDYVAFVADNLEVLRGEAARLVGGDTRADEVYPEVLTDVALRWRRLRLLHRLGRRDATSDFLRRRLVERAKRWREEQIYEVDVRPVPVAAGGPPAGPDSGRPSAAADSVARRLAPLLPATMRVQLRPVAEAAIAWAHAYRRHQLRRLARAGVAVLLAIGGVVQVLDRIPGQ